MRRAGWIVLAAVAVAVVATAGTGRAQPDQRFLVDAWTTAKADHEWLEVRDANGQLLHVLSKNTRYWSVAVSPNGELVTYAGVDGLMVSGLDGSSRRLLFREPVKCRHGFVCVSPAVAWSPDSSQVIVEVLRIRGGQYQTWLDVVSVATGKSHVLIGRRYQTRYSILAWSGPANKIAYISARPTYVPSLVIADPDGKSRHPICTPCGTPEDDPAVAWSPDGHWIAYSPGRGSTMEVYDVGTGTTTTIAHVYGAQPYWSPDSSEIAVGTQNGLAFYSPSGASLGTESAAPGLFLQAWNADGLYFVFGGNDRQKARSLYEIPTGQSTVRTVFTLPAGQVALWAEPLQ